MTFLLDCSKIKGTTSHEVIKLFKFNKVSRFNQFILYNLAVLFGFGLRRLRFRPSSSTSSIARRQTSRALRRLPEVLPARVLKASGLMIGLSRLKSKLKSLKRSEMI